MRRNVKDQQIEKCEKSILIHVQNYFLVRPPYEKYQEIKKIKINFDEFSEYFLDGTHFYSGKWFIPETEISIEQ